MAKSLKSDKWWVRVDGELDALRTALNNFVNELDDVKACYGSYHKGKSGENPHVHFAIEVSTVTQKQSFALRIKKHFTWIANRSDYALAVWDGNRGHGVISYCFHEPDAVQLINKGFSEEELSLAKKENEKVQKLVVKANEKANTRLPELAYAYFRDKGEWSKYTILEFMLKRCKEGLSYYPGPFQLKKYVLEVELRLTPDENFSRLVNRYYGDFFTD